MKHFAWSLIIMLVATVGLAVARPADAQEVSKTITLTRDSKVAGQQLNKGEYSIKFVEGKDGDLVLLRGKKEIVKTSYKVTKLAKPAGDNAVAYTAADDGSFQVKRIEFKGKTEALVLEYLPCSFNLRPQRRRAIVFDSGNWRSHRWA